MRHIRPPPPRVGLLFLYGALDSHPFFPSHVASVRCVLSAAAAGAPAGVVSAFADPSCWCAGAVLVAAGAICALAVPSSWRTGLCWLLRGSFDGFCCPRTSAPPQCLLVSCALGASRVGGLNPEGQQD